MATNFDRWEADPFFSAAECVQDSADRMESAYRSWIHARNLAGSEGADVEPGCSIEFCRQELLTALGTAKWQLEEFGRAVKFSGSGKDGAARHEQFVAAIENQISGIEKALRDSIIEGEKSLRWIRLDKQEKDDLALFLCGGRGSVDDDTNKGVNDAEEEMEELRLEDAPLPKGDSGNCCDADGACALDVKGFRETVSINKDSRFVIELAEHRVNGGFVDKASGHRRSAGADADIGAWKIVIADEDDENRACESRSEKSPYQLNLWGLINNLNLTSKLKWSKSGIKRWKYGMHHHSDSECGTRSTANGMHRIGLDINACPGGNRKILNGFHSPCDIVSDDKQLSGWAGAVQRRMQRSQYFIWYSRPVQISSALLVTLCLAGFITFHAT